MSHTDVLLKKYFQKKKKINPSYSMRALARDLKVDVSFVSRIMSGKQSLPIDQVEPIIKKLGFDDVGATELRRAVANQTLGKLSSTLNTKTPQKISVLDYEDTTDTAAGLSILEPWYNLAVLDLTTCEDFNPSPKWIAKRLQLSIKEIEKAVNFLLENGYIKKQDETLIKTNKKVRLPTRRSLYLVRQYHLQMLKLAGKEMFEKTNDKDFEQRLITNASLAVNPEKIPEAKSRLQELHLEIADLLTEGPCTEIYNLGILLFPLTKPE